MMWHGRIVPAAPRKAALHVLTQVTEADGVGRLGTINEVVSIEPADRDHRSFFAADYASRLGLL